MITKRINPISRSGTKCSECKRLATSIMRLIPYCKIHNPNNIERRLKEKWKLKNV